MRRLRLLFAAAFAVWLSYPSRAFAVGNSVEDKLNPKAGTANLTQTTSTAGGGSMFWSVLQLIVALAIIIAIIYLLIRFLSSRQHLQRGEAIQTLGARSLTNNRSVHLIVLGEKLYLVGVGDNVTLLDTIEDQELLHRLQNEKQSVVPSNNLQELIGKWLQRPKAQAENIELSDLPFDATLREKLNTLKEQRQQVVEDWREGQE